MPFESEAFIYLKTYVLLGDDDWMQLHEFA